MGKIRVHEFTTMTVSSTSRGGVSTSGPQTGSRKWALADSQAYDNGVVYRHYTLAS